MSADLTQWAGRRVLVTGAGGFIGSHVAETLARAGADVRAFVRYNSRNEYGWLETIDTDVLGSVEIFRGDLANPEALQRAVEGCAYVLHLGALIPIPYSYVHAREYVTVNAIGTLNVLEAARRHGVERIVHTSTSEVYGTAQRVPIDESHPLEAQSPYAATKVAADQLALSYFRSFGTPVVVARPFNTYGPRQSARAVIPTVIAQVLQRGVIQIGSVHPTRDFVYADDTVAGMIACADAPAAEGEVVNLGTGTEISIGALIERICDLIGSEVPIEVADERLRPDKSEVERLCADATKAATLLGWRATVDLDDGLARTIEWMRGRLGAYKADLYNV